jgi:hypothetical protein
MKSTTVAGVKVDSKTCLIMDEVDGMSAGDRGGVGALNVLIKKTRVGHISFSQSPPASSQSRVYGARILLHGD